MAKFQKKNNKVSKESPFKIIWEKNNWLIFTAGLILLAFGYYFMSIGGFEDTISLSVSPLVLLAAYLVVFPLAILKKSNKKETNDIS